MVADNGAETLNLPLRRATAGQVNLQRDSMEGRVEPELPGELLDPQVPGHQHNLLWVVASPRQGDGGRRAGVVVEDCRRRQRLGRRRPSSEEGYEIRMKWSIKCEMVPSSLFPSFPSFLGGGGGGEGAVATAPGRIDVGMDC